MNRQLRITLGSARHGICVTRGRPESQKRPTQHSVPSRKCHAGNGVSIRAFDAPEWAALASEADISAPSWRGSLRSLSVFACQVKFVQDSDDSMAFTSSRDGHGARKAAQLAPILYLSNRHGLTSRSG
jgi:hypothetical protein